MQEYEKKQAVIKDYLEVIKKCPLFCDIEKENLEEVLKCLGVSIKEYKKEQIILNEGEQAKNIGVVLSGEVTVIRIEVFGNRTILTSIEPTELFAESFAFSKIPAIPITVISSEDSVVMTIDSNRITATCQNMCEHHNQIILNLLKIVSKKNINLNERIEITSKRSTREKLMAYLKIQAKKSGKLDFEIPFDRQELADYLEVERSGLSAEIGKLKYEGIIKSKKNNFTILR